ncbi:tRNA(Ile)-lysidine synthase [Bacillus mesophilus]|uniref:tRNA lysidine(34) synthetase TilS n=1 Tax=Bacillus mesophilus TaxID=1808955 RepID=UPI00195C4CB6|nr:tRNA lysidine(34) synthetase TilS [Bacillus mesophilus]MBM7663438.1 tRNA(Ile)-lysidine synthase [Bacillus mesophilus]
MKEKVQRFITKHKLLEANATIVVGVSGGPDSLALLHYLALHRESKGYNVIAAHIDHMFRGEQSADEMRFVQEFCEEMNIQCETKQVDVEEYRQQKGISSQQAARECRYHFYEDVMNQYKASHLALGQHGDDQIETILMRLVRGALGKAVTGIQPKRPFGKAYIIRPFLVVTKEEILKYCDKHKLQPRFDPSNSKDLYTRNRFRKNMLPFLKQENPNVHTLFQQFSERQLEDELFLEALTRDRMNTVIKKKKDNHVEISIGELLVLPIPLQRRGLQLILNYLYVHLPSSLSFLHIEEILKLAKSEHPSGFLNFPKGLIIRRSYNNCIFTFKEETVSTYTYFLGNEDKVLLPENQKIWSETYHQYPSSINNSMLVLDSATISFPLLVRNRQQGDKIQLKGTNGSKKIKDIFIDEKVPIIERDTWPIIEDQEGAILWVPGLKKSRFETNDMNKSSYTVLFYTR